MTPLECNDKVLSGVFKLLPNRMDSPEARVLLLAIGLEESGLVYREQIGGPARGLWQFEKAGVEGVLDNITTGGHAVQLCTSRNVNPTVDYVYNALSTDDILAAGFARLLLWSDPSYLPAIGDVETAWNYYLRNWRPGKPRPNAWQYNYSIAVSTIINAG